MEQNPNNSTENTEVMLHLRTKRRKDQNGGAGECGAHLPPGTHQK